MRAFGEMNTDDLWAKRGEVDPYLTPINYTAKRDLESYIINKIGLGDLVKGKGSTAKAHRVTINESDNTRAIGGMRHNTFSDQVLEIALHGQGGYDRNDPEQRAFMEKIGTPGTRFAFGGNEYVVQTEHGTGEHAVLRAVRADTVERVNREQRQILASRGIVLPEGAEYFNNFVPSNYEFASISELRGHYEGLNKGWSPSAADRKSLQGMRFAIVNMQQDGEKIADGTGWVLQRVLPSTGSQ